MRDGQRDDKRFSLSSLLKNPKASKWIMILGIAGILLIFASSFFPGKDNKKADTSDEVTSSEEYAANTEARLTSMLQKIKGVGNVNVMVTLENGVEYVYAQEEKNNGSYSEDVTGENEHRTQQSNDTEKKYILVDSENGKTALIIKEMQPQIKGVVVVCEGGDDATVRQSVIDAVTVALNLSSSKVCVSKMTA